MSKEAKAFNDDWLERFTVRAGGSGVSEKLIGVGFYNGHPHDVYTRDGDVIKTYDVYWCKRDEVCYYEYYCNDDGANNVVEMNGCDEHWLADSYTASRISGADIGRRIDKLPEEWDTWEKFEQWACEEEVVYCKICKDHLPTGDDDLRAMATDDDDATLAYCVCDHVWWNHESGIWDGEGAEK